MKTTNTLVAAACAVMFVAGDAAAVNVYVMSSGDAGVDSAVVAALTSRGHMATIGVPFTAFNGSQNLSSYQTVYLQANANWSTGDMPVVGQEALVSWVNGGGRLVTSEWVAWKAASGQFLVLGAILPLEPTISYGGHTSTTFVAQTPDAAINAGLPASFGVPLDSFAGTESLTPTRAGATAYYASTAVPGVTGLAGWARGTGNVFSFSSTCGTGQVSSADFGRLLANVMGATASGCYANCDGSTTAPILNVLDFNCFLNRFSAGAGYANCDGSTTAPVLNVLDFNCFLNRFSAGCP
jgi:hypothetical protein